MQSNNILLKLESMMSFFSITEKRLGEYILKHSEKVVTMSTSELAKESGVSEATIIRFSRKLEVNGYTELKLSILSSLKKSNDHDLIITDMDASDTPLTIFKKLSAFTITSINATADILDDKSLGDAVDLIEDTHNKNNKIYVVGVGASSILAKEMQIKLMRLKIQAIYYEDSHLQLESVTDISQGDLLICFTTLGKSVQIHQLIEIAHEKSAKTIMVTQYGNKKLDDKVDIKLYISTIESNLRLASHTAMITQSMIIDTLFLILALQNYDEIRADVMKSKDYFNKLRFYSNT